MIGSGWSSTRRSHVRSMPSRERAAAPSCARTSAAACCPRRSPPAACPASSAAISRSGSGAAISTNACRIAGSTSPLASMFPWIAKPCSTRWPAHSTQSRPVKAAARPSAVTALLTDEGHDQHRQPAPDRARPPDRHRERAHRARAGRFPRPPPSPASRPHRHRHAPTASPRQSRNTATELHTQPQRSSDLPRQSKRFQRYAPRDDDSPAPALFDKAGYLRSADASTRPNDRSASRFGCLGGGRPQSLSGCRPVTRRGAGGQGGVRRSLRAGAVTSLRRGALLHREVYPHPRHRVDRVGEVEKLDRQRCCWWAETRAETRTRATQGLVSIGRISYATTGSLRGARSSPRIAGEAATPTEISALSAAAR